LSFKHYRLIKGHAFVVAATAIWSGNFIVARILADTVPPVILVVLRSVIAAICLFPFVIRPLWNCIPVIRKHLGYLALTAFLGLTMSNMLVYVAATFSPALNMSLIAIFSPVFTVILARIFLQEALTSRRVIGLSVAISGVMFLLTDGRVSHLKDLTFSIGDVWMLGQAASFALYSILVRARPLELHPQAFLFSLFILGTLFLTPWFCWELSGMSLSDFSPNTRWAILYLGIGPSLLAYWFWNESVGIIGPARASFVYYLLPLFSGIEALFLLGEPVTEVHIVSGIMILTGVIVATWE
jgi:drug/metabolite transporter (DMT)-like permease